VANDAALLAEGLPYRLPRPITGPAYLPCDARNPGACGWVWLPYRADPGPSAARRRTGYRGGRHGRV